MLRVWRDCPFFEGNPSFDSSFTRATSQKLPGAYLILKIIINYKKKTLPVNGKLWMISRGGTMDSTSNHVGACHLPDFAKTATPDYPEPMAKSGVAPD